LLRAEFTSFHYSITCTSSLWHYSSPYGGRPLAAALPAGARTFLGGIAANAIVLVYRKESMAFI